MRRFLALATLAVALVLPGAAAATAGTNLTNAGQSVDDFAAAFSPDGSTIAFLSIDGTQSDRSSLELMDADGTNVRTLVADLSRGPLELQQHVEWSPDGTLIAVSRDDRAADPFDFAGREPVVVDASTGAVRTVDVGLALNEVAQTVGFTPTNQLVLNVLRCDSTPSCANEIEIAQPGATTASTLYTPDANHSVGKANLDRVGDIGVELSDANDVVTELVLSATGTVLHTVALTADDGAATLSPDGTKVAYVRAAKNSDFAENLEVVHVDGTGRTALTTDGGVWSDPVWSPDSTRLAFGSTQFDASTGDFLGNSVDVITSTGAARQSLVSTDDPLELDDFADSGQVLFDFYNPDYSTCTQGPVWSFCTHDIFSAVAAAAPNTPAGSNVVVDAGSGASLSFSTVTSAGNTTAAQSATGPTPPSGYTLGSPAVYYDLHTTASYSGGITVCIDTTGVSFSGLPGLFHYENGAWVDVTTSSSGTQVCGEVTSLSPFAVFGRPYSVKVLTDLSKPLNAGSTVTLKLKVLAGGTDASASGLVVTATALDGGAPQGDGNQGNVFKFNDKTYSYNLKTKGLKAGGHTLSVTVGASPTPFAIAFSVR